MDNFYLPLSDEEIEQLEQILLERIEEDLYTDGMDEGIFDLSTLDGFFTAIVSGPEAIPPSVWLPKIWGDFEPAWENEQDFNKIISFLMRHMNSVAQSLLEFPDDFEPIFLERHFEEKTYTIVDEWCEGYYLGVTLSQEKWLTPDTQMATLLKPIFAFTQATDWVGHNLPNEQKQQTHQEIIENVRTIYAYWLEKRRDIPPHKLPIQRSEPKVGRNDPCPCGSGKKFKKCCLH
jgi:uncharacterized protein